MSQEFRESDLFHHHVPEVGHTDSQYSVPKFEKVHAAVVQEGVENQKDLCIATPTLNFERFEYYALTSMFTDKRIGRDAMGVLAMTPNSKVRDRYEKLENAAAGGMKFSESHYPLATVTAEETLSRKTQLAANKGRDDSYPPKFIFCKHSNRLPEDSEAIDDIEVVLYDDSLKFEYERWERFQEWVDQHDISTVAYFVRDPIGPVARRVKDKVDIIWAWTPSAIDELVSEETELKKENTVPESTSTELQLLRNRANGIEYDLEIQSGGPVSDAFSHAWQQVQEFDEFVDDLSIDSQEEDRLNGIVNAARRAVAGHSRLLSKPDYSLKYRAKRYHATPHKTRINKLDKAKDSLSGDAGAAFSKLDEVVEQLKELRQTIKESNPSNWKRGAIITAIKHILDSGDTLIIVCPDEAARESLKADLQIENSKLWNKAKPSVNIETHRTLPQAEPADHVLLYGPPKKGQRWVLRTPHGKCTILSYQHELGLLVSQVSSINDSLKDITPVTMDDSGSIIEEHQNKISEDIDLPTLVPNKSDIEEYKIDSPTKATPPYDGISIDIPDEDEIEGYVEENGGSITDYQLIDNSDSESIDEIVSETVSERDDTTRAVSSTTTSINNNQSSKRETTQVPGLVEVRTEDGYAKALNPDDKMEIVDLEVGATVKKAVTDVEEGELVVVVHDRRAIRKQVEEILKESGHYDIVMESRMWHERLEVEIDRRNDWVDDFIERLEKEGLNKGERTYANWYYGRINMPRAKRSLRAIARAYEMEDVLENFDDVWDANQTIRDLKNSLIDELKKRVHEELAQELDEDEFLSEKEDELDIRLSDFPLEDDEGRLFVEHHVVSEVVTNVTRPKSYIGSWRQYEE